MNESANRLFRILVWLFLIAIFAQLFLAGMVAVAEELKDWSLHAALGHMLAFILIPMLIIMYVGQASREVKLLTWVLFARMSTSKTTLLAASEDWMLFSVTQGRRMTWVVCMAQPASLSAMASMAPLVHTMVSCHMMS